MRAVTANAVACLMVLLWACTSEEPANSNGLACEGPDCVCEATTCSAHGNCVLTTEGALCICETGYGNTTCEGCAFGYARVDDTTQCAPRLSRTLPENAGDNCANGGVALLTGLDIDGNGNLDPSEVDETVYVCSASNNGGEGGSGGTSGQGGSGGTSGQGGTAGMDDDAGVSGDGGTGGSGGSAGSGNVAECIVDQCGANGTCMETLSGPRCYCETAYMGNACELCAPGYSLSSTRGCIVPNTLTVTEPEPAGTRCQHGGTRLRSGQDLNDNGTLDENEATLNTFTCNTPLIRTGNVIVASRADLYDLLGVTEITGNLSISAPLIEDLAPLTALTRIGGTLSISAPRLTDIAGLNGLTFIGGGLAISGAAALETLDGFASLLTVRGAIAIQGNAALDTIDTMPSLEACGSFLLTANPVLTSFQGVSARECGPIHIHTNPALQNVDAFHSLVSSGRVRVADNPALLTLTGFEALSITTDMTLPGASTPVLGHVDIRNNVLLESIVGFETLLSVNELKIVGNPALATIPQFSALATPTAILLIDNDALTSVEGFGALQSVARLQIENSERLSTIDAFHNLERIGDIPTCVCIFGPCPPNPPTCAPSSSGSSLLIHNNPALVSVGGFGSLTSVSRWVIADNPSLTALPALHLTAASTEIRFENNGALVELATIEAPSVSTLVIRNNDGLTDMSNLSGISGIAAISIVANALLQDLQGLGGIGSSSSFIITDNAALRSLSGYQGTVRYDVTIANNPMLPQCAAQAFATASGAEDITVTGNDATATCN